MKSLELSIDALCQNKSLPVRFQVLTAAIMVTVFCDSAPCGVVEVERRFRDYTAQHSRNVVFVALAHLSRCPHFENQCMQAYRCIFCKPKGIT
jgi:hypothetical protein